MRKLVKGLGGLLLLCILGGAIALFLLWSSVPDFIASHLSKRLQVNVEIGDIKLSLKELGIERLQIDNPRGYQLPKAFSSEQITIETPPTHLLKDHIEVEQITVNDVYIGLEFDSPKSTKGNWSTILSNAQAAQDKSSASSSNKTVLIKRLVLTNIRAELLYQSDGKVRRLKTIPQIELVNISSQGGDIGDQLLNSALGEAVKEIFIKENLKDALDQLLQSPVGKPIDQYLGPLKGLIK